MNPSERLSVLQRGLAALERVQEQWSAAVPPALMPGQPAFEELRTIDRLLSQLEWASDVAPSDLVEIQWLDATLSMLLSVEDASFLRAVVNAGRTHAGAQLTSDEREALIRLARLTDRYVAREFMPPPSYFGGSEREA